MCEVWIIKGLCTASVEIAAMAAVAQHFGVTAIAKLTDRDALSERNGVRNLLSHAQSTAHSMAYAGIFDVVLDLAVEIALSHAT